MQITLRETLFFFRAEVCRKRSSKGILRVFKNIRWVSLILEQEFF